MLLLSVEEAEPGMQLAMSVLHPQHPEQELLRPGFVLDQAVIDRLRGMRIEFIYVDYPDPSELDRHLAPYLSPVRQSIYSTIKQTILSVQRQARPIVPFGEYYAATRDLLATLLSLGDHPMYLDVLSGKLGSDAVSHAAAVAQLALTLGIRMENYVVQQRRRRMSRARACDVVNLGVAAMLHDIGKAKLPPNLQVYSGINPPEDEKDREEWETHPQIGRDMLRRGVEASASVAVMQHHQHFDGSGFPLLPAREPPTRSGREIYIFARLILAADLFEQLTCGPGQRRRWPIEVLHILRKEYSLWIDPLVLDFLPKVIPPFPPGARVTLSDGTAAVIALVDPADPYYPTIRCVVDGKIKLSDEAIRLRPDGPRRIAKLGSADVRNMIPAV